MRALRGTFWVSLIVGRTLQRNYPSESIGWLAGLTLLTMALLVPIVLIVRELSRRPSRQALNVLKLF